MLSANDQTVRPYEPLLYFCFEIPSFLCRKDGRIDSFKNEFVREIPSWTSWISYKYLQFCLEFGQSKIGSLTGAVASQRVTEVHEGKLKLVGNQLWSVKAKACLTVRLTSQAETKVGFNDPGVPCGRALAQRIKGTLGITGLCPPRALIDGDVWHLDVGSIHPGAAEGPKGSAVRRWKYYASWV